MFKRLFDFCVSASGLLLLSPVFLAVAVLVKVGDGGPVFFLHERIGRGFAPFKMYKFRTMVTDAARLGPAVTKGGDPRITRVGAFLRKTKLDELPQLINVAKGDMSLVGPRPEVARYVEAFRDEYAEILSVRPGITDYASIMYRDEEEVLRGAADLEKTYVGEVLPRKLMLNREYIRKASALEDIRIIFRTIASL